MRIFPSQLAAAISGAVLMPIFLLGWQFITSFTQNNAVTTNILLMLWAIVGFFIPVLFSTTDVRYLVAHWRSKGIFRPSISAEGLKTFYFPSWIRLFTWFAAATISILILHLAGITI